VGLHVTALLPTQVRRFISLGLNRVWLESGDVAYRQGELEVAERVFAA
jgi:hypothetical protein